MTSRRQRAWADDLISVSVVAGSPQTRDLLTNAPVIDTMTAVRIVGYIEVNGAITTEIEYAQLCDVGIGVASIEAFTVAGTSLPAPNVDSDYPPRGWLYVARRQAWQFKAGGAQQQRHDAVFEFDVRSMRKIDKGRLFITMASTDQGGTSTTMLFNGRVRTLCLT